MTRKKFDAKQFQGKLRVYTPVAGATGVLRLWTWDEERKEYRPPLRGSVYEARRRIPGTTKGTTVRQKKGFGTLEEARAWQRAPVSLAESVSLAVTQQQTQAGMIFGELVEHWRIPTRAQRARTVSARKSA